MAFATTGEATGSSRDCRANLTFLSPACFS